MRTSKVRRGGFLMLAASLICLYPRFVSADGESVSSESTVVSNEQLGTGIFSRIPIQVSITARGGYDDNVTTSNVDKQDSWFTNAGLALAYSFGTPRTQLTLSTNFSFTYYFDDRSSVDTGDSNDGFDPNLNLRLDLTHKASPRLSLKVGVYLTYQAEPDFTLAQGINRRSGNYFFTQDRFTAVYLWAPRFSTATSYTFTMLNYDESAVGFFEDRIENTIGNEFGFLIWPTTTLVAEYRFQAVSYADIGGRDSTSHYILGGIDHKFNPRLNASFRGGAEFREYDNAGSQSSPYFETTLGYQLGKDTAITWTSRYGLEESDVIFSPGRETFRTGLQATHRFTPRITGTLAAFYLHDDYLGVTIQNPPGSLTPTTVIPGFIEEAFDLSVALRYGITRYLNVEAGYAHTEVTSDIPLREYSRNRFWGGLTVTF